MKKLTYTGLIAASLFFINACETKTNQQEGETVEAAEEKNDSTLTTDNKKDDADFLVKAANGGLLEVEAGRLAEKLASSKDVKEFAKQMVQDHGKANAELKAYAASKNIAIPDSIDKDTKEKLAKLTEKKGKEFDEEYVDFMVSDHKEDVSLFEDASKDASDPELKAWVDKTLPTLRHHLMMAQERDSLLEAKSSNKGAHNAH